MTPEDPTGTPRVSVVIPSRDRAPVLRRSLEALARQTRPALEVIVVDDASSDGTRDCLESLRAARPGLGLRWLWNPRRRGANGSRNRAIREARGELVAFLDSDCIAEPGWLEALVGGFEDARVAAVTGLVTEPEPRNLYERALRGSCRVHGRGEAPRLVLGNLCVRRELLLENPLDEDLLYGCDEEGLYLRLKARGFRQRFEPRAVVCHEHPHDGRSFLRAAWVGGVAAAWLVYKYRLPPRLDLVPLLGTWLSLPLGWLGAAWPAVPAACFATFLGALLYNERFRKAKGAGEALRVLPALVAYYQVRLAGYLAGQARLRLGGQRVERVDLGELSRRA